MSMPSETCPQCGATLPIGTGSSVLIHPGSYGTYSSGFRAGIPMLVIPYIIDQFIWSYKIAEFGVV